MPPDHERSIQLYRRLAPRYRTLPRIESLRRQAVTALRLYPEAVVLDVGCGTGLSFPLIQEAIGPKGQIVGIDLSPDMLGRARERVEHHGWHNIMLIQSSAEAARIPLRADAAFFMLTHDILQSPPALENVLRHVRPRARVTAASFKWAPWWAWPLNLRLWLLAGRYATTFEGIEHPWDHLARFSSGLQVRSLYFGNMFIAVGTVSDERAPGSLASATT